MQITVLRTFFIVVCFVLCHQFQLRAVAQDSFDDDDNEPTLAKEDPLSPVVLELRKKLRNVTFAEWQKLRKSADEARKAEQFQKSLRLYKEAEILLDHREERSESDPAVPDDDELTFTLALTENFAVLAQYRPAKNRLTELLKKQLNPESTESPGLSICALNQLAAINTMLGLNREADEQLEQATALADKHKLVNSNTIKTKVLLAKKFFLISKFSESKNLFSEVVGLADRLGNTGKETKADALEGLARIANREEKLTEALQNQQKSFALRKEVFGENSLESADSMMILADIKARKEPIEARKLRTTALSIQLNLLKTTAHPRIGFATLALIDVDDQPYSIAEHACETARSTVDGILDEETPFFASYLRTLTKALTNEGKFRPGLEKCQLALSLRTKLFGDHSISVAESLSDLAELQMLDTAMRSSAMNEYENIQCPEAAKSCLRAIAIVDEKLGPESLLSAKYKWILGWIEKFEGKNASAEQALKKSLPIMEACYGADSETVQRERKLLFDVLVSQSKKEEARTLASKMLSDQLKRTGVFDIKVSELLSAISKSEAPSAKEVEPSRSQPLSPVQLPNAEIKAAIEKNKTVVLPTDKVPLPLPLLPPQSQRQAITESLSMKLLQILPSEDSGLLGTLVMLMDHYGGGSLDKRLSARKAALEKKEKVCGSDSPYIASSVVSLAETYAKEKMYSEATTAFNRAISMIDSGWGPKHPALIDPLTKYSTMLKASGNEKEAARQTARCEEIQAEVERHQDKIFQETKNQP